MRKTVVTLLIIVATSCLLLAQKADSTKMRVYHLLVKNTDWQSMGIPGSAGYFMAYHYACDAITKSVFNEGFVEVQILGTSGGGWYPLPHSHYGLNAQVNITFNYKPGYVELRLYGVTKPLSEMAAVNEYKLIVMPGPAKP